MRDAAECVRPILRPPITTPRCGSRDRMRSMSGLMPTPLANQLLIAMPALADTNFSRSVALICQHDDDGAMGIVVNRRSEYTLGEVLRADGHGRRRRRAARARSCWPAARCTRSAASCCTTAARTGIRRCAIADSAVPDHLARHPRGDGARRRPGARAGRAGLRRLGRGPARARTDREQLADRAGRRRAAVRHAAGGALAGRGAAASASTSPIWPTTPATPDGRMRRGRSEARRHRARLRRRRAPHRRRGRQRVRPRRARAGGDRRAWRTAPTGPRSTACTRNGGPDGLVVGDPMTLDGGDQPIRTARPRLRPRAARALPAAGGAGGRAHQLDRGRAALRQPTAPKAASAAARPRRSMRWPRRSSSSAGWPRRDDAVDIPPVRTTARRMTARMPDRPAATPTAACATCSPSKACRAPQLDALLDARSLRRRRAATALRSRWRAHGVHAVLRAVHAHAH